MQHLSTERFAAFADDEPTVAEAMHLAGCAACARERRVYQELLVATRLQREHQDTPLTNWNSLSTALESEGLTGPRVLRFTKRSRVARYAVGLAASLLLLVGGTAVGRFSAGAPIVPANLVAVQQLPATQNQLVAFTSTAQALDVYLNARQELERSAAYLASREPVSREPGANLRARLAAFEEMISTSVAALREAPADPVLNNFYMSTLNAREATMRQISQTAPAGTKVRSY